MSSTRNNDDEYNSEDSCTSISKALFESKKFTDIDVLKELFEVDNETNLVKVKNANYASLWKADEWRLFSKRQLFQAITHDLYAPFMTTLPYMSQMTHIRFYNLENNNFRKMETFSKENSYSRWLIKGFVLDVVTRTGQKNIPFTYTTMKVDRKNFNKNLTFECDTGNKEDLILNDKNCEMQQEVFTWRDKEKYTVIDPSTKEENIDKSIVNQQFSYGVFEVADARLYKRTEQVTENKSIDTYTIFLNFKPLVIFK